MRKLCCATVLLALAVLLSAAASASVALNEANFPGKVLRDYIAGKFDTDEDGILSDEELNSAKYITLSWEKISTFRGLDLLPSLSALDFRNIDADRLDCGRCPKLTSLRYAHSPLKTLDTGYFPNLSKLTCSELQVTSLDLRGNPHLTELGCGDMPLESLNLSNNAELTALTLKNTPLKSLDLSGCAALVNLSCSSLQVTSLDLLRSFELPSSRALLSALNVENNLLTSLDLRNCHSLYDLFFGGNRLSNLDFSSCAKLTWIYCNEPNLCPIQPDDKGKFDLTTLPGNFKPGKASQWKGAKVHGKILTVDPAQPVITYLYDAGRGAKIPFTLVFGDLPDKAQSIEIIFPSEENRFSLEHRDVQFSARVLPEGALQNVTWKASPDKVAIIDPATGQALLVGPGTAKITAQQGKLKKTIKITVYDPRLALTLALDQLGTVTLKVGDTLALHPTVFPESALPSVTWKCKGKSATVDGEGTVTAVQKGVSTVICQSGKKKAKVKIKVVPE